MNCVFTERCLLRRGSLCYTLCMLTYLLSSQSHSESCLRAVQIIVTIALLVYVRKQCSERALLLTVVGKNKMENTIHIIFV